MSSMSKPVVIVTGASRGLGVAIAQWLAKLGASVVLTARTSTDLLKTEKNIRDNGGRAISIPGDISNYLNCEKIVKETIRRFGRLDAVVNNEGNIEPIASIAEGHIEDWETNFKINLFGPLKLIQSSLPYLREQEGTVINVSSGAAVIVTKGLGAYCSAKAALNQFTKVLADEESNITTIAFRPGSVNTSMQEIIREKGKTAMPEPVYQNFINRFDQGKLLAPELPGKAAAILALYAPHEWSGEFIQWDEERVQLLAKQYSIA
jgi:NAD(P)-dependent dehydrogenase (short-subunit alcohol dehydrogenase family)